MIPLVPTALLAAQVVWLTFVRKSPRQRAARDRTNVKNAPMPVSFLVDLEFFFAMIEISFHEKRILIVAVSTRNRIRKFKVVQNTYFCLKGF